MQLLMNAPRHRQLKSSGVSLIDGWCFVAKSGSDSLLFGFKLLKEKSS